MIINTDHREPNSLIHEVSPYLLQHAYNPVQWFGWNEQTFLKAQNEQKPIFLSIGYSTCHWCHVMEHESFEDADVAELLNNNFVSIKLDREERPDIDAVYMEVCQALTGHGGWPLTIVMTPQKKPFFAGTYFPKESRHNRIGLIQLLTNIIQLWQTKRNDINDSADNIFQSLSRYHETKYSTTTLDNSMFSSVIEVITENYDEQYGGMNRAPKFPTPHVYLLLLRLWKKTKNEKCLQIVEHTLKAMYAGGIFDRIGHGFHRYSTDKEWLLPHFEKMLYDQAMLLRLYTEAFHATRNELYKKTALSIIEYVKECLYSDDGCLCSAEDADSEGEEGKFYVWTIDEIRAVLNQSDAEYFIQICNINDKGNFFDEATGEKSGGNIPHFSLNDMDNIDFSRFESIREILKEYRSKRVRPFLDDKVLTDWNALFISSLGYAARVFDNKDLMIFSIKLLDSLETQVIKNGKVYHRSRMNNVDIPAFLDDIACLAFASWEMYQLTLRSKYLNKAIEYANILTSQFYDDDNGGFFTETIHSVQTPFGRQKNEYDSAMPSGNSIACYVLSRLGALLQNNDYNQCVHKTLLLYSHGLTSNPTSYAFLIMTLEYIYSERREIVIANADENSEFFKRVFTSVNRVYDPNTILLSNIGNNLPEHLTLKSGDNAPSVFICENYTCHKPMNSIVEIEEFFLI